MKDFYTYSVTTIGLAAAASASGALQIEADSNFWLQKLTFNAVISAVGTVGTVVASPNVTVLLTDTGSGRQLMSAAIPIPSLFGTGQLPFILPNPRVFKRNSSIAVSFTSYEAANSLTVRLALIGYKEYSDN